MREREVVAGEPRTGGMVWVTWRRDGETEVHVGKAVCLDRVGGRRGMISELFRLLLRERVASCLQFGMCSLKDKEKKDSAPKQQPLDYDDFVVTVLDGSKETATGGTWRTASPAGVNQ